MGCWCRPHRRVIVRQTRRAVESYTWTGFLFNFLQDVCISAETILQLVTSGHVSVFFSINIRFLIVQCPHGQTKPDVKLWHSTNPLIFGYWVGVRQENWHISETRIYFLVCFYFYNYCYLDHFQFSRYLSIGLAALRPPCNRVTLLNKRLEFIAMSVEFKAAHFGTKIKCWEVKWSARMFRRQ